MLDVRASHAMKDADLAAMTGDAGATESVLALRAKPAVDEALAAMETARLTSVWGKEKGDELASVLRDRKAELPRYEEAVKSGDLEKMLATVEAQAAIERRALATVAALQEGR